MKKTLLSTAIGLSFALAPMTSTAVELEVALQYPPVFEEEADSKMARYVVAFYRQIELANMIYSNNDVDITLIPAYIQPLTFTYTSEFNISGDYDEYTTNTEAVSILSRYYDQEENVMPQVDVHVGLTRDDGTLGNAGSYEQDDYDNGGDSSGNRMSLGISVNGMFSEDSIDAHSMLLAHEFGHTVGLDHTQNQVIGNWTDEADEVGYSTLCDDGNYSLMDATFANIPYEEVKISGAEDCLGDTGANSVAFLNKYAPLMAEFIANSNINTLSMDAVENVEDEVFTFTVTRTKNIDEADTGKLYIAGSNNAEQENVTVAPIELTFEAGSDTSAPIDVDFSTIHEMFDISHTGISSTYAVAVLDDEVMPSNIDLLSLNTAWVEPVDETVNEVSNGGGGGGSTNIALLMLMLTALVVRMKTAK